MKKTIALLVLSISIMTVYGQQEDFFPRELTVDDTATLEAIALYPVDDRTAILEVCKYPSFLVSLDAGQKKTQKAFQDIISGFEQENQEKFYELVRYPGLVEKLSTGNKKSKAEIEEINKSYPEDIHEISLELGRKNYEDLKRISQLTEKVKSGFRDLIKDYSAELKEAARRVVELPEVVSLLVDNLNLAVMLGEAYRNNPEKVIAQADEYSLIVAKRNAQELADYQEQLKEDPEAYEEMLAAADKYAEDNDIESHKAEQSADVQVQVVHHYPYWYGYPHWYAAPVWRPVPWYYHTGFYYGPGGGAVFIGMPSPHYVGWHHTYYPNHYSHLSFHYHRHYHRHPHSHSGFHHSVNTHVNRNTTVNINRNVYAGNNVNRNSRPGNTQTGVNRNNNSQSRQTSATRTNTTANRSSSSSRNASTGTTTQRTTSPSRTTTPSRSSNPSYNRHQATQSLQQSQRSSSRSYSSPSRSSAPSRSAPSRSGGARRR